MIGFCVVFPHDVFTLDLAAGLRKAMEPTTLPVDFNA